MAWLVLVVVSFVAKVSLSRERQSHAFEAAFPGRQHLGALFNLVAYYVLALPLGITLAFYWNQGLQGLWVGSCHCFSSLTWDRLRFLGQVVALFIVGLGEYCTVWLGTDWDEEVRRGIERTQNSSLENDR